jgi:hypothetical protein
MILDTSLWILDKRNSFLGYLVSSIQYLVSVRLPGPYRPGTGKQSDIFSTNWSA